MRTNPSRSSTRSSKKARSKKASPGTSLYIHIPFCVHKCHYCDFNSWALDGKPTQPYMDFLIRELEDRAPEKPRTIFIGGGTPSILEPGQLEHFLARLQGITGFRNAAAEVTLECNPESVTEEKAEVLRAGGINRISIGVQSFQTKYLEFYERVHSAAQAAAALQACRRAGFDNINIDLIFGAPGQTLAEWRLDLARGIDLKPDHIAAYDLIFEPGTVLTKWKELGRVQPNRQETQAEMFTATMAELRGAGFEQYEISNYARPGKRCLHNTVYWKNEEYIGVGAGAVSFVGGLRSKNPSSLSAYLAGDAPEESEKLTPEERVGESLMLRLRLREGASRKEILQQTGLDIARVRGEEIDRLLTEGLVTWDGETLALSETGLLLGDAVAGRLL